MTDKERIDRLEHVVGTLISWLHRELGTEGAVELLAMLNDPTHYRGATGRSEGGGR
jgi:hypothetical protein